MSVTILVNGLPITYTDLDDPKAAYERYTGKSSSPAISSSPGTDGRTQSDITLDPSKIQQGIRKEVLTADPDWLAASANMYRYTTGKDWKGTDADLGKWGLDRMSAFNYNIPRMSIDAVRLKAAPEDVKKSFLYLMDGFDKAAWSWGGVKNFLYYAAIDPTTWVGLGTLGIGTAAGKALGAGAKIGVKELLKAGTKVGAIGAIEGGVLGSTSEYLTQTAKVNAGGQAEKDYGKIAQTGAIGAAAGAVLAPALTIGVNKLFGKKASDLHLKPTDETPAAPLVPDQIVPEPIQQSLDLRQPDYTTQPELPGITDVTQTRPINTVTDGQQRYSNNVEPPPVRDPVVDREGAIVKDAFGVPQTQPSAPRVGDTAQGSLELPLPEQQLDLFGKMPTQFGIGGRERRAAAELRRQANLLDPVSTPKVGGRDTFIDPTTGQLAKDAQGVLETKPSYNTSRTRRQAEADDLRTKADELEAKAQEAQSEASRARQEALVEGAQEVRNPDARITSRLPEDRLDVNNNTRDLVSLVRQLGSQNLTEQVTALRRLTKFTDPLTRALKHSTPREAAQFVREMLESPLYQREAGVLQYALDTAVNMMASETKVLVKAADDIKPISIQEYEKLRDAANELRRALDPLRLMSKELKSQGGRNLRFAQQAWFKGDKRHADVDEFLRQMGVDPATATPDQQFAATKMLVEGAVDIKDKVAKDTRLLDAKRALTDIDALADPDGYIRALNDYAALQKNIEDELYASLNIIQKGQQTIKNAMKSAANYIALTVLGPSSVTINAASNFFRTVSRPMLDLLGKGPLEAGAFKEMMIAYGAMRRSTSAAFRAAAESFRISDSILLGHSTKWESDMTNHLAREGQNAVAGFLGRNYVKLWMRMLNSTDEFFAHWAYSGAVEGKAYAEAVERALKENVKGAARDKLIKDAIQEAQKKAYTSPDATMVAQLRDAAIEQGYRGEEINMWVKKRLQEKPELYKRAANEEGISYANDLLFRAEFSGIGLLSGAAKGYESAVRQFPLLRLAGQLFFRTPVRVFEAGVRLTPLVQFTPGTKMLSDLFGYNGVAKQIKAQGEVMFSYGVMMATFTAYANGNITGSGAGLHYQERRRLEETEGWQPYSLKWNGQYISFRNFDPFSTPLKIMVNALERYERMDMERAQGVYDNTDRHKEVLAVMSTALGSTIQAVKDANLAAGAAEWIDLFEAFSDVERSEGKFVRMFKNKAQLLVPNSLRKGIKAFGEDQNVLTDPVTVEQSIESIVNPSSPSVTPAYDALGNKTNTIKQGFLYYLGIEVLSKGQRKLDNEQLWALKEIAKMTIQTGSKFIPPFKSEKFYPGSDLRGVMISGSNETVYNAAMKVYSQLMKDDAIWYLKNSKDLSTGRRGSKGTRVTGFENLVKRKWEQALATVVGNDPRAMEAVSNKLTDTYNVKTGQSDSFTALFN